jgi:hypothetical protein
LIIWVRMFTGDQGGVELADHGVVGRLDQCLHLGGGGPRGGGERRDVRRPGVASELADCRRLIADRSSPQQERYVVDSRLCRFDVSHFGTSP